jgi:hypothetical protein
MTIQEYQNIIYNQQKIDQKIGRIIEKYKDTFGQNMEEIGEVQGADFPIELKPGAKPYATGKYDLSKEAEDEIFKQTKKLLDLKLIELSASPWQAPCIAVPKKDGTWRICQDWRALNARTQPIQHTFPRIHQVLSKLGQYKYYTTLDIFCGYYHLKIKPNDRDYFAYVVTGIGQVRPTRMFFGAMNCPAWFQKTMEKILLPVIFEGWLHVYIDDIVLGANTEEEMINRLDQVLTLLKKANMKVKLSKCQFMKQEVEILGWLVSKKGRKILPKRIEAITKWKPLTNIPSFLGVINYLITTIPHCADYTEKIRKFEKDQSPQTRKDAEDAWQHIVKEITSDKIMSNPEWNKPMEIYTDASDIAVGAVLRQGNKIIEYFSQKLKENQTKSNWWTIHKEAKAIELAIRKFYYYLRPYSNDEKGKPMIKLYCDNQALVQILEKQRQPIDKRISACLSEIVMMNIEPIYIKGLTNQLADSLSRSIMKMKRITRYTKKRFKPY